MNMQASSANRPANLLAGQGGLREVTLKDTPFGYGGSVLKKDKETAAATFGNEGSMRTTGTSARSESQAAAGFIVATDNTDKAALKSIASSESARDALKESLALGNPEDPAIKTATRRLNAAFMQHSHDVVVEMKAQGCDAFDLARKAGLKSPGDLMPPLPARCEDVQAKIDDLYK